MGDKVFIYLHGAFQEQNSESPLQFCKGNKDVSDTDDNCLCFVFLSTAIRGHFFVTNQQAKQESLFLLQHFPFPPVGREKLDWPPSAALLGGDKGILKPAETPLSLLPGFQKHLRWEASKKYPI